LPPHIVNRPSAEPPFVVHEIDVGWSWEDGGVQVLTGAVEHHQRLGLPSIAYRVEGRDGVVVISGDTAPCDDVVELARGADVLVHDAAFLEEIIEERQMWSHSGPSGAGRVAAAAGVKTLVLTHLGPYTSAAPSVAMASMYYGERRGPEIWDEIVARAQAQFDGEIILGRDGLVLAVGQS
jgi:ribonuclease Z